MPYLSEVIHLPIRVVNRFNAAFGILDVLFDKRAERSGVGIAENADQICNTAALFIVRITGIDDHRIADDLICLRIFRCIGELGLQCGFKAHGKHFIEASLRLCFQNRRNRLDIIGYRCGKPRVPIWKQPCP